MSSQNQSKPQSLYPKVISSNPEIDSPFLTNPSSNNYYPSLDQSSPSRSTELKHSSIYPTVDMNDLADLLSDSDSAAPDISEPAEEAVLQIPGAILHLIDRNRSVELASGDFSVSLLRQGESVVAVLARIGSADEINDSGVQWPLARDEASVKLDDSHYFFSLHVPKTEIAEEDESEGVLNYGLTFAAKVNPSLLEKLDGVLETYSSFTVQKVSAKSASGVLEVPVKETKEMREKRSEAYWTTLAPNVEDYSGSVAKVIARGSAQLIKGILWCGDVTVDRLKWGEEMMKGRLSPCSQPTEISKDALKRMKRVKTLTKMSEKVVSGVLEGVIKVSGFITGSVVKSVAGKKFFGFMPGEIALATLDGFGKVSDAVEMVGRNVLQTSSVVTSGVVSHKYGEQVAEMTQEGFDAAGYALGTALAVFKIRKVLNPKTAIKPTTLARSAAKSAAADRKALNSIKSGKKK